MALETSDYLAKIWNKKSEKEILSNFDGVMSKVKKGKTQDWDKL
jgi:hypothetical protein